MDFYITPKIPQTETTTANPQLPPPPSPIRNRKSTSAPPEEMTPYKECLKNHAASIGGHALDGCGEFMPSPTANAADPTSLTCAACDCHRNFHRRVAEDPSPPLNAQPLRVSSTSAPNMLLALRSGALDWNEEENRTVVERKKTKRVRTRFSEEQKEKMYRVSEKLGWRLCKGDEGLVEDFCNEVGIGKAVLKVWMHNNKHTFAAGKNNTTIIKTNVDHAYHTTNANANANGHHHADFQDGGSSSSS